MAASDGKWDLWLGDVMAASDNILQGGGGQEKTDPSTTSDPIYAPVRQRWVINEITLSC